ncbi:MAG: retroviral-like aspartic protease family protein [Acidobacteriia bacterium]|nr:retroviral-like aspartic protease family protein [Terriglobia bacterium]
MAAVLQWLPCPASDVQGEKILLRDGMPFVDVRINGRGPFRMLLDTGTAACMLTPDAARKAGLVYDHRSILTTLAGEKIIPGDSNTHIQVGEASETGVEAVVTELPAVRALDPKADGVLGRSFLGRSAYLIDYGHKRLWLGSDAVRQADRLPVAVTAPESDGRTLLPVRLEPGGRAWRLTLDSGASNLVVDCAERCPPIHEVQPGSRLITFVGERSVVQGLLRHVEVGGHSMPAAEAVLVDSRPSGSGDEGVLPAKWFSAVYVNDKLVRFAAAR